MATKTDDPLGRIAIPGFKRGWIGNNAQIFKTAKSGVNTTVFYDFADTIKMHNKSLAAILHLSPRTISNYRQNQQALEPVQGEHLLKLIALYDKGVELFGSIDEFNYWLDKPFWNETEKPMDWLVTPGGVDLVMQELDRLGYGYPA
ncbi:MAG TPA: antitoxin Xre-like helix-turn-helix domain-containing protein [Mucilaginibacter sp.]|jgi:putative toxin-antitoxin system antitoxin component (TIGR02293 family)|nr:antitoxin Xre-like helix-turn-helix domain-containing protein [Mucilaginibacter sp.]